MVYLHTLELPSEGFSFGSPLRGLGGARHSGMLALGIAEGVCLLKDITKTGKPEGGQGRVRGERDIGKRAWER